MLQSIGMVEDQFNVALSGERREEVAGARISRRHDCVNN